MTKAPVWVQPVIDYAGLVLFAFAFLVTRDVMKATWGMVAGSVIGLGLGLIIHRRLAIMPLFTGGSAIVFGGLSLLFHDAIFVKIKLTIVDGILAAALVGGQLTGRKPLKALLGEALKLPDAVWRTLTWRYSALFIGLALANALIAFTMPEPIWVAFRFPAVPIIAILFSMAQVPLLMQALSTEETPAAPSTD